MRLTDKTCKNAKPKNKQYKMFDGGGLYLLVKPNGSKIWTLKYRYLGKEKTLSFGAYSIVSLAEAREKRQEAKKLLTENIDPSQARKEEKRKAVQNSENTFKAIALEWHSIKKDNWSPSHARNVMLRLEKDVFPHIGATPIETLSSEEILHMLRKIEKRGALDIAGRTKQICGQVCRYGVQTGRGKLDPTAPLAGALRTKKTTHFPALDTKEIPQLIKALQKNDARLYPQTRRAIWLSMLVFLRPSELRKGKWSEIDFQNKEWHLSAQRMKKKRPHIVPLSEQAIAILKEQKEETDLLNTDWIFPSHIRIKKPISDGTVNVALKKLGFHGRQTAHGFRALAQTAIREKLNYDPDIIEVQLAHKPPGPLGETYARSQFLDQRKTMMQEWADYLYKL